MTKQNSSTSRTAAELRAAAIDARIARLQLRLADEQTRLARVARLKYGEAKVRAAQNGLVWSGTVKAIAEQDLARAESDRTTKAQDKTLRIAALKCERDALLADHRRKVVPDRPKEPIRSTRGRPRLAQAAISKYVEIAVCHEQNTARRHVNTRSYIIDKMSKDENITPETAEWRWRKKIRPEVDRMLGREK